MLQIIITFTLCSFFTQQSYTQMVREWSHAGLTHCLLTVCTQCSPPHDAPHTVFPFSVLASGRESASWQKDKELTVWIHSFCWESFSPIKYAAFFATNFTGDCRVECLEMIVFATLEQSLRPCTGIYKALSVKRNTFSLTWTLYKTLAD